MLTELKAIHTNQKSFYGKAHVTNTFTEKPTITTLVLTSYTTDVAKIVHGPTTSVVEVFGTYSATTLVHIKEFLKQNGIPCSTKAFIRREYITSGGKTLYNN